jgi:phage terminase large subunit GpA-like protein
MSVLDKIRAYFLEGFRPPPDFTVSEWADQHRYLPRVSSSEPGLWRTSRTPYLREIMDEMSPRSHTEEVVVMKGSQVGFTECLINITLFYMAHAPGPILSVQPTIGIAERFSKQRLQPSITECVTLKDKVADNKSREGGNTTLQKDFPGGTLILGGANSAAGLRSMPIQTLLLDEVDAYPRDVDGEGDPYELAKRRTTNFARKKILTGSTPTVANESRIDELFRLSDQRYYYVPCPFCGAMQIIKWANIKFTDRDLDSVHLECEACHAPIYERHKTVMLSKGEWRKHNPGSNVAGFHISALYSPTGWYSWADAVNDHLKALGDPLKRKVWVNTVLAEVWDDAAVTIDHSWLMTRREKYADDCPDGVLCLTAGVDTQDDRLECQVVGWGVKGESWIIDYQVLIGDPKYAKVWTRLDEILLRAWGHEKYGQIVIGSTNVDAGGHCTDEVYEFCKQRQVRHVFPVLGRGGAGRQLVARAIKSKRAGTYVFHLGVDQAKATLYARLRLPDAGPGYVHFPAVLPALTGERRELTEQYFQGLTSEKKVQRRHAGLPSFEWVLPPGKRNEPLDTYVYAMSALQILNPNLEMLSAEDKIYSFQPPTPARLGRRMISNGITL